ncbi:class E sortase [Methanobrevibacter sp. DSM 116169]|uniref:class E sortase n=1 Tax=Methanobrevibacter sp. DSM 116169 TaxID=3242727 RepID=UPI0038FC0F6C
MNKPTLTTIIIIIAIIVLGLYAMGEVNYYSTKLSVEKDLDSPVILIPKIGVEERINNVSISQGVHHEELSQNPGEGQVVIWGHRTLQGSPFLRLNELSPGDIVTLQWPGIGELNYTITNSTIVPETYQMEMNGSEDKISLITCDPIGSTANRLIYEGNLTNTGEINNTIIKNNPQQYHALIILLIFIAAGLILSYFYPKENRIYILITVLIISGILIYFYFNPIPSEIIYSKIEWLNGGFLEG